MTVLPNLQQQIDELMKQNALLQQALLTKTNRPITCKVSEKGAVSIYGMGRWPITLYKSQLTRLDAAWDEVMAFAKANDHLLSTKD